MINEVEWYIKPTATGTYVKQKQPNEFEIEVEDLDANSYRSIVTGDLISSVISKNWSKVKFTFEHLTLAQANAILTACSTVPIYAKIENPIYSNGFLEGQFRCSKKSIKKMMTHDKRYTLSLNLVQSKKVAGQ